MRYLNRLKHLYILFIITFINCTHAEKQWDGSLTTRDSIRIVENFGAPYTDVQYELEKKFSIATDSEMDGMFIGKINDVLVLADLGMYVADATNMRICRFGPLVGVHSGGEEPVLQGCYGREGKGPGEFLNISELVYDTEKNMIGAYDGKLKRLLWFQVQPVSFVGSINLKGFIGDIYVLNRDQIVVSKYVFHAEQTFINILNEQGEIERSMLGVNPKTEVNVLSGNTIHIAGTNGKLYVAYPHPYLIQVMNATDYSMEEEITLQKEGFSTASVSRPEVTDSEIRLGGHMDAKINEVFIDSASGLIIVESQLKPFKSELDFFDLSGKYLYSIPLPAEHELAYANKEMICTFIRGAHEALAEVACWKKNISQVQ